MLSKIMEIYKKIIELKESGENALLCTIVMTKGSTPLKSGAKMIVTNDATFGTVGGGTVERKTIEKARELLITSSNKLFKIDLISEEGTSCGGKVEIFIEPLNQNQKLYVFGAGHVGKALVELVTKIGFDVTVIDNREGIFLDWEGNTCKKVISDFTEFLPEIPFDERLFIAIITYDHQIDWEILSYCVDKPWHYLGMMGSHSKVKSMRKKMLGDGFAEKIIDRIDMPIGIDIDAETAGEIAVSIAAKLIMEKNSLS